MPFVFIRFSVLPYVCISQNLAIKLNLTNGSIRAKNSVIHMPKNNSCVKTK